MTAVQGKGHCVCVWVCCVCVFKYIFREVNLVFAVLIILAPWVLLR